MKKRIVLMFLLLTVLGLQAQNVEKQFRKGNRQYKKGDFVEAEVVYRKILEVMPNNADAQFNLGDALFQQENYEAAVEAFQKVVELTPTPN